nr:dual endothelin 1, angiotensin II receptor [Rattus norvegicus]
MSTLYVTAVPKSHSSLPKCQAMMSRTLLTGMAMYLDSSHAGAASMQVSWPPLLTSLGSKEMKSRWNWGSITCIMCFTCVGSQLSMSSSKASNFSGPLQLYQRGIGHITNPYRRPPAPAWPCSSSGTT